ncbi:ribosome biogenesis GTPase A, putative [Plasmodium vivax]|uniref:Ribosome biogenesis GTPase A, putative n=1 Tax=Plasmodium vivax TaxID=5855 RepID=A0A564ZP96_PLAVI|nr:ribosome biogenesis GTPase A, putative [Plasmodium vivax]
MALTFLLLLVCVTRGALGIHVPQPNVARPNVARPNVARPNVERSHVAQPNVERPHVAQPNVERPHVTTITQSAHTRRVGKLLFLSPPSNPRRAHLHPNRVQNKRETNPEEKHPPTFDEYFNKRAEEDYTKLEAEKLKIMRESVSSYRGEIRKVLERSYKSEYEKLLREEKEDEEVSGQVHENLKITFLMKESINNFLFTRYSYMINRLKEQSAILRGLRGGAKQGEAKEGETKEGEVKGDSKVDDFKTRDFQPGDFQPGDFQPGDFQPGMMAQSVQFFRPQTGSSRGSGAGARNCPTFSDQIFANAKLLLGTKGDAPVGSSFPLEREQQQNEQKERKERKEAIGEEDNPMTGSPTEELENEQKLFPRSNVSALDLFKHNVNAFLSYKRENIIKENLHENLLYGRVKVHWFPKFMKRVITKLSDYIKMSDVIVEVRNGIIPLVFDDLPSLDMFNFRTNKPRIIVYTNCDRSSIKGNEEWGSYYRRKLFWYDKHFNRKLEDKEGMENQLKKSAVIFVDAKNGKKEIIVLKKLIKRLCHHVIERKRKKGIHNYKVKCIFIGLPNVGKSALINRLLEVRKTKSYDHPGLTTNIQMYSSKLYELIDTPGILAPNLYTLRGRLLTSRNAILDRIYNRHPGDDQAGGNIAYIGNYHSYMHVENSIYLLALCNHISPKMYHIYNAAETLLQNVHRAYLYDNDYVEMARILKRYQISFTECVDFEGKFSAYHFIQRLARDRFHNDLDQAAMRLVTDFRKCYLGRMTLSYPLYFNRRAIRLRVAARYARPPADRYVGW